MNYQFYDAAYFDEDGAKGNVYSNYIAVSRASEIYREIARAITQVFRPRRALEVGCATGLIVRYLNDAGVDAHGIDVSTWAISNREHPNVHLAGAEQLPFPDDHFDFVYSVHALEHIPSSMKDRAFSELRRVCTRSQFHMLPMIGHGNYVGERNAVVQALMKDPSHTLIEDRNWWLIQFDKIGFRDTASYLFFENDPNADLSDSQVIVSRDTDNADLLRKSRSWNVEVLQRALHRAEVLRGGIFQPANAKVATSRIVEGRTGWRDIELELNSIRATPELHFLLRVELRGESTSLRLCILTANGGEADAWRTFHPGVTTIQLKIEDLVVRKSRIVNELINKVLFGGETKSDVSVQAAAFIKTS